MEKIKFIDLFCGIGGFRSAMDQACIENDLIPECVFSSDIDSFCQDSYEANFGERPFGDITKIDEKDIQEGLQKTKKLTGLHGRWEIIHERPTIILDVGHNEDGIKQIIQQIELTTHHELHIITGMVKDKEIDKVLSLLPHSANYYFTQAHIPRALPAEILKEKAAEYNLKGKVFTDVNDAIKEAKAKAHEDDLILVCGSVFLVGEVNTSVH